MRRIAALETDLASTRVVQRVFTWYEHIDKVDEYRVDRRVLMAEVDGGRGVNRD